MKRRNRIFSVDNEPSNTDEKLEDIEDYTFEQENDESNDDTKHINTDDNLGYNYTLGDHDSNLLNAAIKSLESSSDLSDEDSNTMKPLSTIDNLTLSCFMNKKNKYKKHVEKLNLIGIADSETDEKKCKNYKNQILDYTYKMLDEGFSIAHNSKIQNSFEEYAKHLIDHFEYEEKILQDKDNMVRREKYESDWEAPSSRPAAFFGSASHRSYWGGKIVKK